MRTEIKSYIELSAFFRQFALEDDRIKKFFFHEEDRALDYVAQADFESPLFNVEMVRPQIREIDHYQIYQVYACEIVISKLAENGNRESELDAFNVSNEIMWDFYMWVRSRALESEVLIRNNRQYVSSSDEYGSGEAFLCGWAFTLEIQTQPPNLEAYKLRSMHQVNQYLPVYRGSPGTLEIIIDGFSFSLFWDDSDTTKEAILNQFVEAINNENLILATAQTDGHTLTIASDFSGGSFMVAFAATPQHTWDELLWQ